MSLVAVGYQPPRQENAVAANIAANSSVTNDEKPVAHGVDEVVAASVVASIADRANLPLRYNIANLSQSLQAESALAQTGPVGAIQKPQIVQPSSTGRSIQEYVTKEGDTVQSVASSYQISGDTLKWANSLTSDALEPGKTLKIPPVDGVLYTVKAGDSAESIAQKYRSEAQLIVSYNDLELGGLDAGRQIIVPNGALPEEERPGYVAPRSSVSSSYAGINYGNYGGGSASANYMSMSAGNKYAFGNCTWYVYERRVQLGRPVGSFWGNATTWASNAAAAGLLVNGNPAPGAIMQNGGGYGHVAVVEAVNPGVSITISEMNGYRFGGGFNRIGRGDVSWGEATSGMYRYIH